MREMPARTVTAAKPHRCAFCGEQISTGAQLLLCRAFDTDRSKDGGKTWGAWVQERWHVACRYPIAKPAEGAPCNGCGLCCAEEACALAIELLDTTATPCPALEWDGARWRCGLIASPGKYLGCSAPANGVVAGIFAKALGAGMGCDSGAPAGMVRDV